MIHTNSPARRTVARPLIAVAASAAAIALLAGCTAGAEPSTAANDTASAPATVDLENVAPGLAGFGDEHVMGDLWSREGLTPRDRSLVTVAQMVAAGQTEELEFYVDKAIEDGVEPAEISETPTQLAFYSGWGNATDAVPAVQAVFERRGVDAAELPTFETALLPIDQVAEEARAQSVEADYGTVSPGVVQNTGEVLFQNLWLRPELAPRDRSLVTVVDLISTGQVAQVPVHLGREMDNGLTAEEVSETLNQLAFYAGWPRVFSAMPVVRDVLESRG